MALSIMGTEPERLSKVVTFGTAYALDVPRIMVPFMELGYKMLGRETIARLGAPLTCKDKKPQAVIYAMLRDIDVDVVVRMT